MNLFVLWIWFGCGLFGGSLAACEFFHEENSSHPELREIYRRAPPHVLMYMILGPLQLPFLLHSLLQPWWTRVTRGFLGATPPPPASTVSLPPWPDDPREQWELFRQIDPDFRRDVSITDFLARWPRGVGNPKPIPLPPIPIPSVPSAPSPPEPESHDHVP
jgi:hypothetical protein